MKKIEQMCKRYGITYIQQEESYTSKASFLDGDSIPVYNKDSDEVYLFSGKRTKRGMYVTKKQVEINADLNGAANILRKSNHKFHLGEVDRGILTFPTRIRLLTPKKRKNLKVLSKNHVTLVVWGSKNC